MNFVHDSLGVIRAALEAMAGKAGGRGAKAFLEERYS